MQKDFCDNCDSELTNYRAIIRGTVVHKMSTGEYVGEDEYKSVDLCVNCVDKVKTFLPCIFNAQRLYDGCAEVHRPDPDMPDIHL